MWEKDKRGRGGWESCDASNKNKECEGAIAMNEECVVKIRELEEEEEGRGGEGRGVFDVRTEWQ